MRTLPALLLLVAPLLAGDPITATKTKTAVEFKDGDTVVAKYATSGDDVPKPHLWPLNAPGGVPVSAHTPADHKHHKSVWFCHGDVIPEGVELKSRSADKRVEGVDFWSETKGHGKIVCVEVGDPKADKTGATVATKNEWRTPDGDTIMEEARVVGVRKLEHGYLFTFAIDLHASKCDITFGDTKEGAFGVRVNEAIGNPKGGNGTLTASGDRTGEKAIWGTAIDWTDYSGTVDGKAVGLAIFDHPKNPQRATSHGRAYGLVAANPFGRDKSGFPSQKGKTELVKLKKGEHLKLQYAAYAHTGDAKTGGVAEAYKEFSK